MPILQGWKSFGLIKAEGSLSYAGSSVGTHLPPVWPGLDSQTLHVCGFSSVGYLLCSKSFFSRYSTFPLSSKTNVGFDMPEWFDLIYFCTVSLIPISASALSTCDTSLDKVHYCTGFYCLSKCSELIAIQYNYYLIHLGLLDVIPIT